MYDLRFFLKDASDEEREDLGERELKNVGPRYNTENCQIILHSGRRKEFDERTTI